MTTPPRARRPGGYLKVSRAFFDPMDPFWGEARTFSRAEAWLDLLELAAWRRESRVIGAHAVALDRGEFAASIRYLGERWRWSKDAVARFLAALQRVGRVQPQRVERRIGVYAIVDYAMMMVDLAADSAADDAIGLTHPRQSAAGLSAVAADTSVSQAPANPDSAATTTATTTATVGETVMSRNSNDLGAVPATVRATTTATTTATKNREEGEEEKRTTLPPAADAATAGRHGGRGDGAARRRPSADRPCGAPHAKAAAKYPHFPADVCARLCDAWIELAGTAGMQDPDAFRGRFRRAFAVLYPASGPRYVEPLLRDAMTAYREITQEEDRFEFSHASPEGFLRGHAEWARVAALGRVTETGEMTEWMMRAVGGGLWRGGRAA